MKIFFTILLFIINGVLLYKIFQKTEVGFDYNKYLKNNYLFEEDEKVIVFIENSMIETEYCTLEASQIKSFDKELNRIRTVYDPSKNINVISSANLSDSIVNIETKNNKNYCLRYPGFSKIRKIQDGHFFEPSGKFILLTDINSAIYIFSSDFKEVVYTFKLPQKNILDVELGAFSTAHLLTFDSKLKRSCVEYWDFYSRLRMAQKCFSDPVGKYKKMSLSNNGVVVSNDFNDSFISIEDI